MPPPSVRGRMRSLPSWAAVRKRRSLPSSAAVARGGLRWLVAVVAWVVSVSGAVCADARDAIADEVGAPAGSFGDGARLRVRLRGNGGSRVDEGRVVISCAEGSLVRESTIDGDGFVLFDDLPVGRCFLSASGRDHQPLSGVPVDLQGGSEVILQLTLSWTGPVRRGRPAAGPVADALPLPARRLPDWVRGAASGPFSVRLDGFDLTDRAATALPLDGLAAVEVVPLPGAADRAWHPGTPVIVSTRSGSNKLDATALVGAGVRAGYAGAPVSGPVGAFATAGVSGPLWRDHLWYAATLEGDRTGGRGLATLVWQASARAKFRLVAAGAGAREDTLIGLGTEMLLTDSLVVQLQVGYSRNPQGNFLLQYFADNGRAGEQAVSLGVRVGPDDRRALVLLEDAWRPIRYLTLTGTFAVASAPTAGNVPSQSTLDPEDPGADPAQVVKVPGLGLAWDATHDGRTVVRASASPGQVALGVERELIAGLAASIDLLPHALLFAVHKPEGRLCFHVQQRLPIDLADPGLTHAAVGWSWDGLGLSALVTRDRTYSFGLRAHEQVGRWLSFPLALMADALAGGGTYGLRLSLRTSY